MNNLCPDHWIISDFRKEHKELIRCITIGFRKFLKDCDYINGKSISGDGSKIKACALRVPLSLKQIDKKLANAEKEIERYLAQLNENDAIENEQEATLTMSAELKDKVTSLQKEIEELEARKNMLESSGQEWVWETERKVKSLFFKGNLSKMRS